MKTPAFLIGLGIISAAFVCATLAAEGQSVEESAAVHLLEQAMQNPQGLMFVEQTTSKCTTDGEELHITSARGVNGEAQGVILLPGKMQVFRADTRVDEFTKQGGWYWKCGKDSGKLQFKQSGAVIMVVRDLDGTVHWYALGIDLRC
jgi:hypothetical protein